MAEAPAFDRAFALYPYTGKWRQLLGAYKFGSHRPLAQFFAEKLCRAADAFLDNSNDWEWTPVPARAGKVKEKGWDQIETIAHVLKNAHHMPVRQTLKRLQSDSQKELGREKRLTNLKGRIVSLAPASRNVILFDDVYTTGSTLNVCAGVLKAAGAERVYGLCLFYGQ
jgi:ComF family protein